MTLPRSARVATIIVLRAAPAEAPDNDPDEWGRTPRTDATGDPDEVLRTVGDIQPRRMRGGSGETITVSGAGSAYGDFVVFTDVLDIRTGDMLRTGPRAWFGMDDLISPADMPDDGLRYNVVRVDRPGRGRRLDHLEIGCERVTSGVVALV